MGKRSDVLEEVMHSIEIESYSSMMSIRSLAVNMQLSKEERKIALEAVVNKLQSMLDETRRLI